jgi:hypothetical protein
VPPSGNDTFNVTPSNTVAFKMNGGLPNPPASPGVTLDLNLASMTTSHLSETFSSATGFSGQWTFDNCPTVSFSNIEMLLPADALLTNTTFVFLEAPAGWMLSTPAVGSGGTVTATGASVRFGTYHFTLVVHVRGPSTCRSLSTDGKRRRNQDGEGRCLPRLAFSRQVSRHSGELRVAASGVGRHGRRC